MKLWCFVTGNVFLLQGLKKGLMSASGSSSNLIPVVHCMLFFIVILLYSGLKKKKKKKEGAISYFTFETKMGSLIFWQTFNL